MDQPVEQETEAKANLSSQDQSRFHLTEDAIADELRCVRCGARIADAVCGRKNPCSFCGFPYPLGDCSDMAEN